MSGAGSSIPLHSLAFNGESMGMRGQVSAVKIKMVSIHSELSYSSFPEDKTTSVVPIFTEQLELEKMNGGENIVKWIKGQRISWLGHLERMEEDRMPKKELRSRTGRDET
jgi:hypothetical protein